MTADGQVTGNIYHVCGFKNKVGKMVGKVAVLFVDAGKLILMRIGKQQICN